MAETRADYRHTVLLFVLLGVGLIGALVIRSLLVPDTFGELGSFRAAALGDARAPGTMHIGVAGCGECHEEVLALHAKDAHLAVDCEDCHGPGRMHAQDPEAHAVIKPDGKQACLECHRALLARPGWFPQIETAAHYAFVGVADAATACTACHDPHEPLYMDRDIHSARLHPMIHRCRDCHPNRQNEGQARPADHPPIFECAYCHAPVVNDFAERAHAEVRCTTCHIFFRLSEDAGRILRDADPRFCLLCHRNADFRSDDGPPGIEWPGHLDDVAEAEADRKKRCIDCHRDRIHLTQAPPKAPAAQAMPGQEVQP